MKDLVLVALIVIAFALFVTAHVGIVYGLAFRPPRWRALVAFGIPPAGAYWAWRERMRARAIVWLASAVLYAVARVLASF